MLEVPPGCPFSSPNNRYHDVSCGVSIWVGIWGVRAAAGAEPWVCGMQHPHCVHPSPSGDLQPDGALGPLDGKGCWRQGHRTCHKTNP